MALPGCSHWNHCEDSGMRKRSKACEILRVRYYNSWVGLVCFQSASSCLSLRSGWEWPQLVPPEMPLLCSGLNSSGWGKESKQRNSVGGTRKQLLVPGEQPESAAVSRSEPHTHTHICQELRPFGFKFWVVPQILSFLNSWEKSDVLAEGTLNWTDAQRPLWNWCHWLPQEYLANPQDIFFFTAPASVANQQVVPTACDIEKSWLL